MTFMLLCLIYSLTGAEINTVLIAPAQGRAKMWLQFFCFLFAMSALKLWTMPYPVANMCSHFILFLGYFLMLRYQTKWGIRRVAAIYFFILVLECFGDLTAIVFLALKNGRFVIPGQFEPEGVLAMLISNSMQILMAYGWKRKFAGKAKKEVERRPERLERRLIVGIHFVFMGLLLALSLTTKTGGNRMLPTLLVLQVTSIVLLMLVLIRDVKNQEIREMQIQLKNKERKDQAFYQCYKETEDAYRSLHKLRHDFHNQLSVAIALLESGESEKANGILNQMEDMLKGGVKNNGEKE